jgi:histidinol-phosphate phosphatase family protein
MHAIFLDRDGVICRNRADHVRNWSEFVFVARAREALTRLAGLNLPIVVVTNQAVVNRDILSAAEVDEIHRRMVDSVEAAGGRIDQVYYCPHLPDEQCSCRKPRTGLLERAAADLEIQLEGSYLVGDAWSDIQAGIAVGCIPFLVLTGRGLSQAPQALREGPGRFRIVRDLYEAATAIQYTERAAAHQRTWSQPDLVLTRSDSSQRVLVPRQPISPRTK